MKSKASIISIFATIACSFILFSCNSNSVSVNLNDPAIPATPCFQNDVFPILFNGCAMSRCHDSASARSGYDLSSHKLDSTNPSLTYARIMSHGIAPGIPESSRLYTVIASGSMPEDGHSKITSTQLGTIYRWIQQGAQNSTCPCDSTGNVTYSATIAGIISTNCSGCHSNSTANTYGGGFSFEGYTNLVAENSVRLINTLLHTDGYSAMPKGGAKLSDCNISKINKWIKSGEPNN